jgi:predicted alpha/beta hydrolase
VWHQVSLPLRNGAPGGELLFHADGQIVQKVTLFAASGVEETFSHAIARRLGAPWALMGIFGLAGVGLFMFFRRRT